MFFNFRPRKIQILQKNRSPRAFAVENEFFFRKLLCFGCFYLSVNLSVDPSVDPSVGHSVELSVELSVDLSVGQLVVFVRLTETFSEISGFCKIDGSFCVLAVFW